jgi:hypothetical protein
LNASAWIVGADGGRLALDPLDDEHRERLRETLRAEPPGHPPIRLTVATNHRAVVRLVVVEFERAEGSAARGDERIGRDRREVVQRLLVVPRPS